MPPRKKARLTDTATPDPAEISRLGDEDVLNDPWTDEEETGLFKGLIKWKPTGIHKHFRMIQLHEYLLDNHYIHPQVEHTKIPGIWRKLQTLYDLDALDQREDARQLSDISTDEEEDDEEGEDAYSEAANKIHNEDFVLSEDEYGDSMWMRRLAGEKDLGNESPIALSEINRPDLPPVDFNPSFVEPMPRKRGRPPKDPNAPKRPVGRPRKSRKESEEPEEEDTEDSDEDDESDDGARPARRGRSSRGGVSKRGRPRTRKKV